MSIAFNITTDTRIVLYVSITDSGTIAIRNLNRTERNDRYLMSEDWYGNDLGAVGSALSRNIARCARLLTETQDAEGYDDDLLLENVREGIAALLLGSSHKDGSKYWRDLNGCIIESLELTD